MTEIAEKPVWSHIISVTDIPAAGLNIEFAASPVEREDLRQLSGLAALSKIQARFHLTRKGKDGLRATGEMTAEGKQICVVSLELFALQLNEPIDVAFQPLEEIERRRPGAESAVLSEEGMRAIEEEPEPIINGRVNLGALASQFFILGLDPYPRKPGATFDSALVPSEKNTPFEALRHLDKKK